MAKTGQRLPVASGGHSSYFQKIIQEALYVLKSWRVMNIVAELLTEVDIYDCRTFKFTSALFAAIVFSLFRKMSSTSFTPVSLL